MFLLFVTLLASANELDLDTLDIGGTPPANSVEFTVGKETVRVEEDVVCSPSSTSFLGMSLIRTMYFIDDDDLVEKVWLQVDDATVRSKLAHAFSPVPRRGSAGAPRFAAPAHDLSVLPVGGSSTTVIEVTDKNPEDPGGPIGPGSGGPGGDGPIQQVQCECLCSAWSNMCAHACDLSGSSVRTSNCSAVGDGTCSYDCVCNSGQGGTGEIRPCWPVPVQ